MLQPSQKWKSLDSMANIEATKAHSWDLSEIQGVDVLGDDGGLFPWSLGEHTELGEGNASE